MKNLFGNIGQMAQKNIVNALIEASKASDFDTQTFFTEDGLNDIFNTASKDLLADLKKTVKKSTKKSGKKGTGRTNTWMVYFKEQRPIVQTANPSAKFQDLAKLCSESWQQLSDDEKQVYKDKAAAINAAAATANSTSPPPPTVKKKTTRAKTPPKKKVKKKKTPAAPKKAKKKKPVVQEEEEEDFGDELDAILSEDE